MGLEKLYNLTITWEVFAAAYTKDEIPETVLYQNIQLLSFFFIFLFCKKTLIYGNL